MKFEYDGAADNRECVAKLFKFGGGNELCLSIKLSGGDFLWMYPFDRDASVQRNSNDFNNDDALVRKFYPGDKITITF